MLRSSMRAAVLLACAVCAGANPTDVNLDNLRRMRDRLPEDDENRAALEEKITKAMNTPPAPPSHPKDVGLWIDRYVRVAEQVTHYAQELKGRVAYASSYDDTGRYEVHFATPNREGRTTFALHPSILKPIPDEEAPAKLKKMWPTKAMKAKKKKEKKAKAKAEGAAAAAAGEAEAAGKEELRRLRI
mmetsp:Transcript_4164/g.9075  ORF Transcript_4164/g.9075 Transcript_4164/m.9075 type:complete len:187 (-) Transcript_4164:161-721(-)